MLPSDTIGSVISSGPDGASVAASVVVAAAVVAAAAVVVAGAAVVAAGAAVVVPPAGAPHDDITSAKHSRMPIVKHSFLLINFFPPIFYV